MRLAVISFTAAGSVLCRRLVVSLNQLGHDCRGYIPERFLVSGADSDKLTAQTMMTKEWTGRQFESQDGIIFIGATGIAVRSVAPFIKDKMTDPAVVAIDELARFSISLLSGHMGGANDLAVLVARITGAEPVITTASDLNGLFAVDVFAKEHGLILTDRVMAKCITADILEGKTVGFFSDFPVEGQLPANLEAGQACEHNIWITVKKNSERIEIKEGQVLRLIPRIVYLGVGCRKGISAAAVKEQAEAVIANAGLNPVSVAGVASIDLKQEEQGIVELAKWFGTPYFTYSKEELLTVCGCFSDSAFVEKTVGVGNVCERAALLAAGRQGTEARLLVRKQAKDKVTAAVAVSGWKVRF